MIVLTTIPRRSYNAKRPLVLARAQPKRPVEPFVTPAGATWVAEGENMVFIVKGQKKAFLAKEDFVDFAPHLLRK